MFLSVDGGSSQILHQHLLGGLPSSIKKSLACLPVQIGMHVLNARTHISKAPDIRVIMGL
jgi:hypothetical protein